MQPDTKIVNFCASHSTSTKPISQRCTNDGLRGPNSTQNVEEQNNQDKQVETKKSGLKLFPVTTVHRASRITKNLIKVTQCTIATQHSLCKDTRLTPISAHKLFHAIHRRAKWLRKWEPQVCLPSHVGRGAMP